MKPCRILVVDDNKEGAESLVALFTLRGHDALVANDGMEALQVAERFRPQITLMDLGMPNLNGHDAARCIRGQPWGGDMILVALSGWGQQEDRAKSKSADFDVHLVKPNDYEELTQLLAELFSRRDSA